MEKIQAMCEDFLMIHKAYNDVLTGFDNWKIFIGVNNEVAKIDFDNKIRLH